MKNWIIFLISMVVASSFCAAENQIQKVTYFPLPYAAYHNINATTLDIGVGRVEPKVSLGQSGVSTVPLSASTTTVTQRLTLEGKTEGKSGIIGKDNNALRVTLDGGTSSGTDVSFGRNLRVNALTNADSVSAKQMKLKGLKLFGKDFPACAEQEMHWVRLNLKDNPVCSWYLMCGSLDLVSGYECTPGESSSSQTCKQAHDGGQGCGTTKIYDTTKNSQTFAVGKFITTCCKAISTCKEWVQAGNSCHTGESLVDLSTAGSSSSQCCVETSRKFCWKKVGSSGPFVACTYNYTSIDTNNLKVSDTYWPPNAIYTGTGNQICSEGTLNNLCEYDDSVWQCIEHSDCPEN